MWLSVLGPRAPIHVTVDWSGVPDKTVERCGLVGLQAMLLQTLLESGFAVVEQNESAQISLEIRERRQRLVLVARGRGILRRVSLGIPRKCDGTIQYPLQRATLSVLRQLQADWPPAPAEDSDVRVQLVRQPSHDVKPLIRVGATSSSVAIPFVMLGGGLGVFLTRRASIWVVGEVALRKASNLTLMEPALDVSIRSELGYTGPIGWRFGIGLAILGHAYFTSGKGSGHVDVQARAPLTLVWQEVGIFLELATRMRTRPIAYTVDGEQTYDSSRLGVAVSLGYLFGGSQSPIMEKSEPSRASND
jgi:hypothetical protein